MKNQCYCLAAAQAGMLKTRTLQQWKLVLRIHVHFKTVIADRSDR